LWDCCLQVLLLVWDDATNNSGLSAGLMGTHDERTYKYFEHTKVVCVKCPRQGGSEDSYLQVRSSRWWWVGLRPWLAGLRPWLAWLAGWHDAALWL